MSDDGSNQIRNFQYNLSNEYHRQFLQVAFGIGILPKDPRPQLVSSTWGAGYYNVNIETFLQGESIKAVSLVAENPTHQKFVWYGLQIKLFPSTFLDYLQYNLGSSYENFSSEDTDSVTLLMQGIEQALRVAFDLPPTQVGTPRKESFSQLMGEETVTIIVGEGECAKKFVIHKHLLMNKVVFFEKMFNSKFLESSTGSATLPEDSPEAFDVLVEWIYCSTLKTLHGETATDPCLPDLAISIIGLAEKYVLPELGDRTITYLANVGKELPPTMGQMRTLYEQTPSNSKARKYAARTVAWALVNPEASGISNAAIQQACQDGDVLLDAIAEIRGKNGRNGERAHTFPICDYHNHEKASTCPYEGGQEQTAKQRHRKRSQRRNQH